MRLHQPLPNSRLNVLGLFPEQPQDNGVLVVRKQIEQELSTYGMRLVVPDMSGARWEDISAACAACDSGIAVLPPAADRDYELASAAFVGALLIQGKPVRLLQDSVAIGKKWPPLFGASVASVSLSSASSGDGISQLILQFLRRTGVAKLPEEKLILFVSYAGTCRCAMAMTVLRQALSGRYMPFPLRVESVAFTFGVSERASANARRAVLDAYGEDFLSSHRVWARCDGLLREADIILAMDESQLVDMPPNKTFLFNEFFGGEGDVVNPWSEDTSEEARAQYASCLSHLRAMIEPDTHSLLAHLRLGVG